MKSRVSARQVVEQLAEELLERQGDPGRDYKLMALEVVALRMNWKPLYEKLRFRNSTRKEQWWEK